MFKYLSKYRYLRHKNSYLYTITNINRNIVLNESVRQRALGAAIYDVSEPSFGTAVQLVLVITATTSRWRSSLTRLCITMKALAVSFAMRVSVCS